MGLTKVIRSWMTFSTAPNKNVGPNEAMRAGTIDACFFLLLLTKSTLAESGVNDARVCWENELKNLVS